MQSNKPFYNLQDQDREYILEFLQTCERIGMGNVSFQYYATSDGTYEVFFYLTKYNTYWHLMVKHQRQDNTKIFWSLADIYKIQDGKIEYDYSEKDML